MIYDTRTRGMRDIFTDAQGVFGAAQGALDQAKGYEGAIETAYREAADGAAGAYPGTDANSYVDNSTTDNSPGDSDANANPMPENADDIAKGAIDFASGAASGAADPSFWDKYKLWIIAGGIALVIAIWIIMSD